MEFIITGKIIPYVRMTNKGKWVDERAKTYLASQQAIAWQFKEQCPQMLPERRPIRVAIEIQTPTPYTGDLDNWGLNLKRKRGILSMSNRTEYGAFCFLSAVNFHNILLWAKRPLSGGLTSRCAIRHRRQPGRGCFVMSKEWTQEDIDFLSLNYETMQHKEIARILGRTKRAIKSKCWKMGLRKDFDEWSPAHIELLKKFYASPEAIDLDALALAVGRHKTNVSRKARELGLTNQNRPKSEQAKEGMSARAKQRIAKNGHPRGYLGHTPNEETRKAIGQKSIEAWKNPNSKFHTEEHKQLRSDIMAQRQREGKMRQAYSRGRQGKRDDLDGLFVRSSWEANYARYLNWLIQIKQIKNWEYESITFEFTEIKRGSRFYTPDFTITNMDDSIEYHEIKGWMDQKSQTKLRRMEKYHPHVKLVLIDAEAYKALAKDVKRFILYWE